VIGSVYASLYSDAFVRTAALPAEAAEAARESVGGALLAAERLAAQGSGEAAQALTAMASAGFFDGLQAGCLVAAGLCAAGALFAAAVLPAQPVVEDEPAVGDEPDLAVAGATLAS
jgi:hypothetical protein